MSKSTVTDMTTGNPLSLLIRFTLPVFIGNTFQQFYNLVDSLVVGNFVGANALAAVGTCGSLSFLFFSLSAGLALGIGVVAAQYYGARDEQKLREIVVNSIFILVTASLIVSCTGYFFAPLILSALQVPDVILPDAVTYLQVTSLGMIAVALYNGVSSIFRALGDSKTPLYFLLISSALNILLDLLLVLQFHLGVFGVALATIISQAVSCIISIWHARRTLSCFQLTRAEIRPDSAMITRLIRLGIPMALQNSLIAVSTMTLQGVVNTFGGTVMAAFTVSGRVENLVHLPFMSLSTALTSYAGQNAGACKLDRIKQGYRISAILVVLIGIASIPLSYLYGEFIVSCFVNDPEVIAIGAKGLLINSLFYIALGMIYTPRAILNGCGDSAFAMINSVAEVICRVLYSQIFTGIAALSFYGLWVTNGLTWLTTSLICMYRYYKGKWRSMGISGD